MRLRKEKQYWLVLGACPIQLGVTVEIEISDVMSV